MSAIRTTLGDARDSRIPYVLGYCRDDPRVADVVNEAQRRLLNKGRWWGTYQVIQLCVNQACVTWPRQVANVEAVDVCNDPVPIENQWWEFVQHSDGMRPNDCCNRLTMIDRGLKPSFADILGANKKLRVYPTVATDVGKRILFQGIDQNGIDIRTQENGVWIDGFYITLALPYSDSEQILSVLTAVPKKDNTDGRVLVYELNTLTDAQRLLAIYDPVEPTPHYRRSFIDPLSAAQCCGDTCALKTVTALVKLAFIPAAVDTDFLIIGNLDALKDMAQSIVKREKDLAADARAFEMSAIAELRHELRTHTGDRSTVNVNLFGTSPLRRLFQAFR